MAKEFRRQETPTRRVNPSGKVAWIARWTDKTGKVRKGWAPDIKGTWPTKREAQQAIWDCYARDEAGPSTPSTIGQYAATWLDTHPRGHVTNTTNQSRLNVALTLTVEKVPLGDWPLELVKRRQANVIAGLLLERGLARSTVNSILGVLRAMFEDAIEDECAVANPFRGMKTIRSNDPRIKTSRRPVRVFSWSDMHAFAEAARLATGGDEDLMAWRRVYAEPMVRTLSDCGLRIGELFPLCRSDVDFTAGTLRVEWTMTTTGSVLAGTKTDHGEQSAGRTVPVPAVLLGMLDALPTRLDVTFRRGETIERPLFPSAAGCVWVHSRFYRAVWGPARKAAESDARPHEFRHSWVSLLRAEGIDVADLASAAGHSAETASKVYTHALGRSFDAMRQAVGQ